MDLLDMHHRPLGFPDPTLRTTALEITDFRWPNVFVRLNRSGLGTPWLIRLHVVLISEMLALGLWYCMTECGRIIPVSFVECRMKHIAAFSHFFWPLACLWVLYNQILEWLLFFHSFKEVQRNALMEKMMRVMEEGFIKALFSIRWGWFW